MPTVAEQLHGAREAKNLTVYQIAETTKIKTDHIRALEEGNYNVFSAPVYIRGFVRTYASLLKLDVAQVMATLDQELARGMAANKVFKGDTLDGLASQIGVSADTLRASVDEYNACYDDGYDGLFAKDRVYLDPIRKAPFYAVRLALAAFMTNGGIRINHKTEVLKEDRTVIPGLYAAGCTAGGILGDTYEVSTTGGSLAFAVNTGRMAGESVLHYLGK